MRRNSIISLFIFIASFMILRFAAYSTSKRTNLIFKKTTEQLSNQVFILFLCWLTLLTLYVYGALDKIKVNWEYFIRTLAVFIIGWIIFGFILNLFCLSICKKWEDLESFSNSFSLLKEKIKETPNDHMIIESFEFLILKRYFFSPLFPMLKPASLRKELKFSSYLTYCLMDKIRLFFKISWTCWLALIVVMMFWNVFLSNTSTLTITLFLLLIPLLGICIPLVIYIYLKSRYRKVISPVTTESMLEIKDVPYNSNDLFQSLTYPVYLKDIIDDGGKEEKNSQKNHDFTFNE